MSAELATPPAEPLALLCPLCGVGFVRRLPSVFIEGDPEVTATTVHIEHSEPPCNAFAGHSRSLHSRDDTLIHVPAELERLAPALRAVLLQLWERPA